MKAPRLIVAATHSGAGKSSWTLGLLAALRARSLAVQPFKAGPDYIDPGLHTAACGRVSRNLDTRLMSGARVRRLFLRAADGADISLVEGVMGYLDGALDERARGLAAGSTAELARVLECPVVLVIDVRGMSDSAGAVARGFARHAGGGLIRGFLLNRVGSERHAAAVRGAVERATGLPVLGALPREETLAMPERHLGLVDAAGMDDFNGALRRLGEAVAAAADLDALRAIAEAAPPIEEPRVDGLPFDAPAVPRLPLVRIAVARDEAFSFIYEDNLDILRALGAETAFFSPLRDDGMPEGIGGAYLCGGYPEVYARELAANEPMRASVRRAVESGMPVFAECGGYMYLHDELACMGGARVPGAGVLRGCAVMGKRRAAVGYCRAEAVADTILAPRGAVLTGHVFHYSSIEGADPGEPPAFLLEAPRGAPVPDGCSRGALLASYLHLHFASCPAAARRFVGRCRRFAGLKGAVHA